MNSTPNVQAVLDGITDPAILLDRDYRIVLANRAYAAVYGAGANLLQRRCYEVSHGNSVPCDLAGEHCPLKQCLETGQTARVLHVHHTPRGQEYVNVETWPIRSDDGEVMHFVEVLRPSTIARPVSGDGLIGKSPAFQAMLGNVDRVAPTPTSVLLLGESGTGKELIARSVHERSSRNSGPFVPVECAGLPETLFESELFGYVKGAFTGASGNKLGLVEAAAGGTLFLDEIGEIPLSDQVKLLRLLETRQFRRIGSTEPRTTDFRLICATNQDLAAQVAAGEFREDLYYRLSVFEIVLPPLRERAGDLALLVEHLLRRVHARPRMSRAAMAVLERYEFPGNIRELRNIVERAVIMCDGDEILPEHLPPRLALAASAEHGSRAAAAADVRPLADVEADYLRAAVTAHRGDRRSLAAQLGLSERALYRKLARLRGH
jgi:transcriptional regulator with PAS, ATPase and Fis domain